MPTSNRNPCRCSSILLVRAPRSPSPWPLQMSWITALSTKRGRNWESAGSGTASAPLYQWIDDDFDRVLTACGELEPSAGFSQWQAMANHIRDSDSVLANQFHRFGEVLTAACIGRHHRNLVTPEVK